MLVETGTQKTLPPRDSIRRAKSSSRIRAGREIGVGGFILIGAVLSVVVLLAVPRPDVTIQSAQYHVSGCTVTATFALVNRGSADGYVAVSLLSGGTSVASQDYVVPAEGTVPGSISGTLPGCSGGPYDLSVLYIPPPG